MSTPNLKINLYKFKYGTVHVLGIESYFVPFRAEVHRRHNHIVHALNQHRDLATSGRLQELLEDFQSVLKDVRRTHVDLRHDHEDGNTERQRETQVLLRHSDHACVRSHLNTSEVRISRNAGHRCNNKPTINMLKSGACPVIPNIVVFRYFS